MDNLPKIPWQCALRLGIVYWPPHDRRVPDGLLYIFQMSTFPVSRADSDLRSPIDLGRRYARTYVKDPGVLQQPEMAGK